MPNSIAPGFIRINYHSGFGLHSMTLPSFGVSIGGLGDLVVQKANGLGTAGITAIEDFVDLLVPFFPASVIFDSFTAFNKPDEDSLPLPISGGSFTGKVGTSGSPGWFKAVQTTITWRTADFNLVKIVLLDSASGNDFDPVLSAAADPATDDLDVYMRSGDCIVSGRDNTQATTFIRETSTLNEKLRRSYRMT